MMMMNIIFLLIFFQCWDSQIIYYFWPFDFLLLRTPTTWIQLFVSTSIRHPLIPRLLKTNSKNFQITRFAIDTHATKILEIETL